MQLERFKAISQMVENDKGLLETICSASIFRKFDDVWYNIEDEEIIDEAEIQNLNKTLLADGSWKHRNSSTCFYPLKEVGAVVVGTFSAPPKSRKRKKVGELVDSAFSNAVNAFGVTHNELTGLINKSEFNARLESALESTNSPVDVEPSFEKENKSVSVLSLDIDFFKQVNDTHGHQYGDIVLKAFANRLQQVSYEIEQLNTSIKVIPAHLSGEEFCVILIGSQPDALLNIAEKYRDSIASQPLPREDEWSQLKGDFPGGLPHSSDRKISASIGVASHTGKFASDSLAQVSEKVKHKSDMALFRAKACGRNIVINFDDILEKYGRVLEHHAEVGFVAIDIGESCNVQFGQEFIVYHPKFTGKKPFLYSDGRTKKALGVYPKVPCGRIVAFEIQNEISFCKVTENNVNGLFPINSSLEAVEMGSISHLLAQGFPQGNRLNIAPNLTPAEEVTNKINEIVDSSEFPSFAVFSIKNISKLITDRGIAFINDSLAELFKMILSSFPERTIVCQLSQHEFGVVCLSSNVNLAAKDVIDNTNEHFLGAVEVKVGVATAEYIDNNEIDVKYGLDMANYAASIASQEVEEFDLTTARRVVDGSFDAHKFGKALMDFKKFKDIGIEDVHMANTAAICAYKLKQFPQARDAMLYAIETDHDNNFAALRATLGVFEFALKNYIEAFKKFSEAFELDEEFEVPEHYSLSYALSKYYALDEYPKKIDKSLLKEDLKLYISDLEKYHLDSIVVDIDWINKVIEEL